MEERTGRVIVSRPGGTASKNAVGYKVTIPNKWAAELGLSADEREIKLTYDGEKIIIEKI